MQAGVCTEAEGVFPSDPVSFVVRAVCLEGLWMSSWLRRESAQWMVVSATIIHGSPAPRKAKRGTGRALLPEGP